MTQWQAFTYVVKHFTPPSNFLSAQAISVTFTSKDCSLDSLESIIIIIIVDEMSMTGQKMLAWFDKRLRQASGKLDITFGGFSIVLIRDFGQLPPVGDKPLYALPCVNYLSIHGHHVYRLFETVVILDQMIRQQGADATAQNFLNLLARINALHSSRVAATSSSGGLHATLFLAEGATVMLTANLCQEVGLCNGAPGTVFKILYPDDGAPPDQTFPLQL